MSKAGTLGKMDDGSIDMLRFSGTAEAASVRAYLLAQATKNFTDASNFFTDDVVFNDVMFPVSGRDEVVKSLSDYVEQYLTSFRVEAANEAGATDRYLVLCFISVKDSDLQIPTGEYITLREGKICRVDNCFNVKKFCKSC